MTSAVRHTRTEREESCFSRAARAIRRALSRICRDRSSPVYADTLPVLQSDNEQPLHRPVSPRRQSDINHEDGSHYAMFRPKAVHSPPIPVLGNNSFVDSSHPQSETYTGLVGAPPLKQSSANEEPQNEIKFGFHHARGNKKYKKCSFVFPSTTDEPVAMMESSSSAGDFTPGASWDSTRETVVKATGQQGRPAVIQDSTVRRALSRIRRGRSASSRHQRYVGPHEYAGCALKNQGVKDDGPLPPSTHFTGCVRPPFPTCSINSSFDPDSYSSQGPSPPTPQPQKRILNGHSSGGNKKYKKGSLDIASTTVYMSDEPVAMMESSSSAEDFTPGASRDTTRETVMKATGHLSSDDNDPDCFASYHRGKKRIRLGDRGARKYSRASTDPYLHPPNRKDTDNRGPTFKSVSVIKHTCSQSITPTLDGPLCAQGRPAVIQDSTVSTKGSGAQDAFEFLSAESENEPEGDGDVLMEMYAPVTAVNYSVTNALPEQCPLPPPRRRSDSSCLSRSHSMPSLSQITSAENKTFRRSKSSPDMLLQSSFEEFTPDIAADENDETYRLQCSCPGLYLCSVTGLVFHMGGGGDVVYRTVPWDRRLLSQHHKKPAGPLFDIKCEQQSVRGLHLPHCEIRSTGGCEFLSVAHVRDEGVEFISPHKMTETHLVINISGFSGFGNVRDEDSSPDPVRALVLLFYRPPADPDPESLLNVLLLPRNVVLRDVLRIRKKSVGDESYIETSPHCKLHPKQEYTLSTCPEDDQILVQPTEAEFDCDEYDNYFPSFQVTWETALKHIKLFLRDTNSSKCVWERRVCLSSAGVRRSCGPSALNLPPRERLLVIRIGFIDGISGPVLKSLLDKLLEKTVITDSEREAADVIQNKRDKARFVIDTVRKKGEAASSEMIEIFCEADPFLCEHLGLI